MWGPSSQTISRWMNDFSPTSIGFTNSPLTSCPSCTSASLIPSPSRLRSESSSSPAAVTVINPQAPVVFHLPICRRRFYCLHYTSNLHLLESLTMSLKNSEANGSQEEGLSEEKRAKISEVRNLLEPVPDKLLLYCSDASIARYLRARNWNVKKAAKMLKETLKWRLEYKPEDIRWDEIAQEAETGKIYRSNCLDKNGRCILVMRPGCENSKSTKGRIRYLIYCMENAILNLPPDQEQMIWLIDFCGYNMSNLSVKVTKETADVLQNHYPERLGLAILYNPPKFFEPFWLLVKPFLEPKTSKKVKFVYSDNQASMKLMEEFFDMDELEKAFGGKSEAGFEISEYAKRMRDDDKKMNLYWSESNKRTAAAAAERSAMAEPSSSSEMNSDEPHRKEEEKSSFKQMVANGEVSQYFPLEPK